MRRIGVITAVLVVALLLATQPVFAAVQTPPPLSEAWTYEKAVDRVQPFVSVDTDGFIVLNPPQGIVESIDPVVYRHLLESVEMTNYMIGEGYLVCNDDLSLIITKHYVETVTVQYEQLGGEAKLSLVEPDFSTSSVIVINGGGGGGSNDPTSPYYRGVNKVVWYWWGFDLYLDHYNCVRVVAGIAICAVLAWLLPSPVNVIISAGLAAIAGLISIANADSRGVVITYLTFTPFLPPCAPPLLVYIRSQ